MFINRIEMKMVRERVQPYSGEGIELGRKINGPEDAFRLFGWLSERVQEEVYALHLDAKNRAIGYSLISRGTVDKAIARPADVLRPALLCNAVSIILAHNHPSGDPDPSHEDRQMTKQMNEACTLMGIKVLDHLVIGDGSYRSLKEAGEL